MKKKLKEVQRYCLEREMPFLSYVMPGEKNPVSLFSSDGQVKVYNHINEINCERGFLMSPFQSEDCPVIVIPDTLKETGWEVNEKVLAQFPKHFNPKKSNSNNYQPSVTFPEYSAQIDEIKKNLQLGIANKVVLSRVKLIDNFDFTQLPKLFEELVHQYPLAFVYLVSTPETGTWIGATPETLIQINSQNFSTMALAGTKGFSESEDREDWSEKDIKEQDHVVQHVRQRLFDGGYPYHEAERKTIQAGNVMHLQTLFQGDLANIHSDWKKLSTLLYPTPAICGTDNEATLHLIKKVEKHKREYYTGILGPFNNMGQTDLFINLRCMKVIGNKSLLFAGGGILPESSAIEEWGETELKFSTLLQVIKFVHEKSKIE